MSQALLLISSKYIRMSCTGSLHPDSQERITFACEEWAREHDEDCHHTDRIKPDEIPEIHVVAPGDVITIEVHRNREAIETMECIFGRKIAGTVAFKIPESGLPKPPESLIFHAGDTVQNSSGDEREYDYMCHRTQKGIIRYLEKNCVPVAS